MATDTLLNTTSDVNGKTMVTAEGDRSITGLLTFARGASAPFAVAAGAANVANLDAAKLNGQAGPAGTLVGTSDSQTLTNKTLTAPVINGSISGSPAVFNRVTAISTTGTVNDANLGLVGNSIVPFTNASDTIIDGIANGYDGQVIILESQGTGNVFLAHQNAGSAAANRLINFATSSNTPLAAGVGTAILVYDGSASRWRMVQHQQGTWITPAYSAGNFTASGGTWTVDSGDISSFGYILSGRTLTVSWNISTSSVGAGVTTNLIIGNGAWGGFTSTISRFGAHSNTDNGAESLGRCLPSSGTTIVLQRTGLGNWTVSANTTATFGTVIFDVT